MLKNPDNYLEQKRDPEGRWISKLGIPKGVSPVSVKLPAYFDEILRSLSKERLTELCGKPDRSTYLRKALVNQMIADGLIPQDAIALAPEPRTRKRKTAPVKEQFPPNQEKSITLNDSLSIE